MNDDEQRSKTMARKFLAPFFRKCGLAAVTVATLFLLPTNVLAISSEKVTSEQEKSWLQAHYCPYPEIDEAGLPNLKICDPYWPDATKVVACQNQQSANWRRIVEYNKMCKRK